MKIAILTTSVTLLLLITSCDKDLKQEQVINQSNLLAVTTTVESTSKIKYYVTAPSGLSLRSGSNLNSKKVLTLPYGSQVSLVSTPEHTEMTVESIQGKMIEVSYQGATGFAFDGYLTTLAPPQKDESIEAYAKRISTKENNVQVSKIANKKGENYGMITAINLPAKNWGEAYRITQRLFNLPKSIQPDLTPGKGLDVFENAKKRTRTKVDELVIMRDTADAIKNITYRYKLRDYSREVTIKKVNNEFIINETENSL